MATTATTLAGAVSASEWLIQLASKTGLRAGDNIVLTATAETMRALVVDPAAGTPIIVYRGARGTAGRAAAGGAAVTYGAPTDYGAGVGITSLQVEGVAAELLAEDVAEREKRAEKLVAAHVAEAEKAAAAVAAAAKKAADEKKAADKAADEPHPTARR
jgi:hypothetical protein